MVKEEYRKDVECLRTKYKRDNEDDDNEGNNPSIRNATKIKEMKVKVKFWSWKEDEIKIMKIVREDRCKYG